MESWLPAVSALGGAVLGGAALMLADSLRWRREREVRWEDTRRHLYADFLDALAEMHRNTLLAVHLHNPDPDKEWEAARVAWNRASSLCNQILLLAPQFVIDAATSLLVAHQELNVQLEVHRGVSVARDTYARLVSKDPGAERRLFDLNSSGESVFLAAARRDLNPES